MAYDPTQSPFTDLNYVRKHVGDVSATPLFSDNELNGLLARFTVDGVADIYKAAGWALRALAVDPDRALQVKKDSGMSLADFMEHCWKRSEVLLG